MSGMSSSSRFREIFFNEYAAAPALAASIMPPTPGETKASAMCMNIILLQKIPTGAFAAPHSTLHGFLR
jgi:hypothetical protein